MIQKLSNENLIEQTHSLFKEERRLDLEVLRHLFEIERRKLFLERGFPSLFEMCIQEFKLSPASAQRRISAMRLLKEIPEVAPKIESGELSVSVIAQTQSFFRMEKKQERAYTKEEKLELVRSLENKSAREVEKELAAKNTQVIHYESVKPVSQTQTKLTVIIDHETKAMLDQIKDLISHSNPKMTYEGVITRAAKLLLEKELKKVQPLKVKQREFSFPEKIHFADILEPAETLEPSSQTKKGPASSETVSLPTSEVKSTLKPSVNENRGRRPSTAVRKFIWQRDEGKCTYTDPVTGHICGSRAFLQFDHIQPWSQNGKTIEENLRLLCGAHNRGRH